MATLGDDCFFFYTSTCVKGPTCPFRHVEAAKTCKIICQHWQMGNCLRPMCKFRHSIFPLPTSTADTPCYWETQPVGCAKKTCPYKHTKPRPDRSGTDQASGDQKNSASAPSSDTAPVPVKTAQPQASAPQESKEPHTDTALKTSPPQTVAPDSEEKVVNEENDENSNKENGSNPSKKTLVEKSKNPAAVKPKAKKVMVKAGVKKKSPVLTTKKKVVKKVPAKKAVKKTIAEKASPKETSSTVKISKVSKSVKERLGAAKAKVTVAPPDGSESSSDSSDSVDNIKVLSMEEILRQRALDSMMKKRAAEGKSEVPAKPAPAPVKIPTKKIPPSRTAVNKKSPTSAPVRPVKTKKVVPVVETSETESSSADSESTSSEESEDSEDSASDVRRVVVEVNDEVAARNRAKASLLKRQGGSIRGIQTGKVVKAKDRLGGLGTSSGKKLKRRMLDLDYHSDEISSSRVKAPLNVRDRLGKLPLSHAASSSQLATDVRTTELKSSPRKAVLVKPNRGTEEDSSDEDSDSLEGVEVKTLDQIKREKVRKAVGNLQREEAGDAPVLSVKQRLGSASPKKQQAVEEESGGGRHVLITTSSGSKSDEASNEATSNEQKKAKKRPWRSKKQFVVGEKEDGDNQKEDERTTVVVSSESTRQDNPASRLEQGSDENEVEESPFARLKRRALQKKLQSLQQSKGISLTRNVVKELDLEEGPSETADNVQEKRPEQEEEEEGKGKKDDSHKKHKHKHKHKHHKKSKKERQIYMPPALKNAAQDPVTSPFKRESSPTPEAAAPTTKVGTSQRRGGPHPIAAAWAAGLSLSAKGVARVRPPPLAQPETSEPQVAAKVMRRPGLVSGPSSSAELVKKTISLSSSQPTSEPTGTVIKSFSEIMAEKRRRRLEQQANKPGNQSSTVTISSSSSLSMAAASTTIVTTSPIKPADARPKVPITPIVFNSDSQSSSVVKLKPQPSSTPSLPTSQQIPRRSAVPISPIIINASSAKSSSLTFPQPSQSLSSLPSSIPSETVKTQTSLPSTQEKQTNVQKTVPKKNLSSSSPRFGKKAVGQKKVLKTQKSTEHSVSASSLASMGITIPLPPMTLEEELLLDEGAASGLEVPTTEPITGGFVATKPIVETSPAQPQVKLQEEKQMPSASSAAPYTPARFSPPAAVAVATAAKHRLPSSGGAEASLKKPRLSLDDELALFDESMEGFDSNPDEGATMEPIDDLLQNIDDLLA